MSRPPPPRAVTILEQSRVSPPRGSVPTTRLPLTFFDLLWYLCCPVQRLFFHQSPHSAQHLLDAVIPSLQRSLSLTLQHFFPFAGNLICPPSPAKPHILFSPGDSVPFTVAESAGAFDFDGLAADCPRDVLQLHPFVPELPPARAQAGARVVPLLAVQVTVFPSSGFTVGTTFCHVAADGRSYHHFMKSWASVCKAGGDPTAIEKSFPFHGRDSMKVLLEGLEVGLLEDFWAWASKREEKDSGPIENGLAGKVRATFLLGKAQIERVKHWVGDHQSDKIDSNSVHISAFVVTCALIWVCLIKSEEIEASNFGDKDKPYFLVFSADCRARLDFPIPITYFGNCLTFSAVSVHQSELVGANGIVEAVKAIGTKVRELESNGVLGGADKWMKDWKEIVEKYQYVTVAGSPKLGIYETDFGWGRPKKTELVHTDVSGAISLCDHREDKLGIEVSLALTRARMDRFSALLDEGLKLMA